MFLRQRDHFMTSPIQKSYCSYTYTILSSPPYACHAQYIHKRQYHIQQVVVTDMRQQHYAQPRVHLVESRQCKQAAGTNY